jgi:hypothetical protein
VENAAALEIRKTIGGLRHLFVDADFHSSLEKPRKSTRLSHIYHRPDYDHQYGRNFHLKNYKGWLRHKEKAAKPTLAPQTGWSVRHWCFGYGGFDCFQHRLQVVKEDVILEP